MAGVCRFERPVVIQARRRGSERIVFERDVFNQNSLRPSTGYRTAGKADPFDRVDCRQKRSAFTKRGDNGTGYRSTVVGHRRRLNCTQ